MEPFTILHLHGPGDGFAGVEPASALPCPVAGPSLGEALREELIRSPSDLSLLVDLRGHAPVRLSWRALCPTAGVAELRVGSTPRAGPAMGSAAWSDGGLIRGSPVGSDGAAANESEYGSGNVDAVALLMMGLEDGAERDLIRRTALWWVGEGRARIFDSGVPIAAFGYATPAFMANPAVATVLVAVATAHFGQLGVVRRTGRADREPKQA